MKDVIDLILLLTGFGIIAVASHSLSALFTKIHLPFITGILVIGILCGPFVLGMIPAQAIGKLHFLEEITLAFIAYAAGSELHLEELRSRIKSIVFMTFWQVFLVFSICSITTFFLSTYIPFMNTMGVLSRIAVSLILGTIFIARSPASAIAVIKEMRARGPFTKTAIGVTVLVDFIVVIMFAVVITIAIVMISGTGFDFMVILRLIVELFLSAVFGYILGKALSFFLVIIRIGWLKILLVLFSGLSVYLLSSIIEEWTSLLYFKIHLEPLLICIIGSFIITNYSKCKADFINIIHKTGTPVYIIFFTITGASMELDVLAEMWLIAFILFGIRTFALISGGIIGGLSVKDSWKFNITAWTPYITQAGVSLGLTAVVAISFPAWGAQFETLIIAVIVLSQFIGPPVFKWALQITGESHKRKINDQEENRNVTIFGLFGTSIALAKQLYENGWNVQIISRSGKPKEELVRGINILEVNDLKKQTLTSKGAFQTDAIVCMYSSDDENYMICEMAYEHFGTREIITILNDRNNAGLFYELDVLIVDPSSAIISLLDHMVRSPHATNLLLGTGKDQDTIEVKVKNPDIHGLALRNIRLPKDIIILSISRDEQMIISHGYTRLRLGDMVTLVGSVESLETARLLLE